MSPCRCWGDLDGHQPPPLGVEGVERAIARSVGGGDEAGHVGTRQAAAVLQRVLQHRDHGLLQRDDLRLKLVLGLGVAPGEPVPPPLVPLVVGPLHLRTGPMERLGHLLVIAAVIVFVVVTIVAGVSVPKPAPGRWWEFAMAGRVVSRVVLRPVDALDGVSVLG